jgi:opacity protein-like surface antigen
MRLTRSLATGLASLVLLPAVGIAQQQQGRLFQNSWFWGVTAGVQTFWTTAVSHQQAPSFGLDWLITQKHTGLYLSLEESFFHQNNVQYKNVGRQYSDSTLSTYSDIGYYSATPIKNATQMDVAFMFFPGNGPIRPYAGIGAAFNWVEGTKVNQNGQYTLANNPNQRCDIPYGGGLGDPCTSGYGPPQYWYPEYYGSQYRDDAADFINPLLILGIQIQVNRVSIFGQAKVQATNDDHIFNNQAIYELQAGVRFNLSSALSKDDKM